MNNVERIVATCIVGAALLALLASPAQAEVGAYVHPDGRISSYIFQIIVDEIDPVDDEWVPYHPVGSNPILLNELGEANGDGRPTILMRSAPGLPVVAWSRNSPTGFDIVVSRFDGQAWTVPQAIAATAADELEPHLTIDPADGSIHVVYRIDDPTPRILHRQAPADLSTWSPPTEVSYPGDVAVRPSAAFHEGTLHVAYELHDQGLGTTPRQIVVTRREGSVFIGEIVATTAHEGENRPQVHAANGRLWVDWVDTDCDMAWRRRVAPGSWQSIQVELYENVEQREFHVRRQIRILALD